jgi:hypothetical protein
MDATHATLPCTFVWDTIDNSIVHEDTEDPDRPRLPADLAVAALIPRHLHHSVKWTISDISIPLGQGDLFWFHYDYNGQLQSMPPTLGKLVTIHYFIGHYAVVDIAPILHYNQDQGWKAEEGDTFWIKVQDLVLNLQQRRHAQRAYLQNPTFTLLDMNDE